MRTEFITLNEERNVTLTAYLQEVGGEFYYIKNRPAVLILPGGGYQMCSDREADPVVFPYLKAGYQAFILRYSIKKDAVWPQPLLDYEQAVTLIRENAEKWHVIPDKISVIGFSAGGHLASAAATLSVNRPNAAILGYPVTGEDAHGLAPTAPDTAAAVDQRTCPCFLFATCNDNIVPIRNSIRFMEALSRFDITFESHIYAYGPHGFSTCETAVQDRKAPVCDRVENWVQDSIGWLKDIFGDFGETGLTDPRCPAKTTANHEATLSIDCTMEKLMSVEASKAIITQLLQQMTAAGTVAQAPEGSEELNVLGLRMSLRDCLGFSQVPQEVLDHLDEQLRQIDNPDFKA